MRDFKNMKRQRGRNRGSGGNSGGGNGGRPQQNANRAFDSNGPDNVKIRGHAQHVFEKYQQLARDAFSSGDRVLAENYLQHADHYFRVLRAIQPQRPPAEILGRDVFASGLDLDFEEDFDSEDGGDIPPGGEGGDAGGDARYEQPPRDGGQREYGGQRDGQRDTREWGQNDRQQNDRQQGDRGYSDRGQRDYGQRDNAQRDNGPRDAGQSTRENGRRDDRFEGRQDRGEFRQGGGQGGNQDRDGRGRRNDGRRDNRFDDRNSGRQDVDPLAVTTPEANPGPMVAELAVEPVAALAAGVEASVLRSEDGAVSQAPAFLQAAPVGEDGEPRRTRTRRRRPRSFENGDGGENTEPAPTESETA